MAETSCRGDVLLNITPDHLQEWHLSFERKGQKQTLLEVNVESSEVLSSVGFGTFYA